jgi:FixJ family two-component response regulator
MSQRKPIIAVVDDEESVRKALVRYFKAVDIAVQAFGSAREFLSSLKTSRFDCLVLDLQMPEMTGLDLQRYLQMVRPDLAIPVIIITAHDDQSVRERCTAAGVGAYLRKPVEGKALLAAVEKLIRTSTGEGSMFDSTDV